LKNIEGNLTRSIISGPSDSDCTLDVVGSQDHENQPSANIATESLANDDAKLQIVLTKGISSGQLLHVAIEEEPAESSRDEEPQGSDQETTLTLGMTLTVTAITVIFCESIRAFKWLSGVFSGVIYHDSKLGPVFKSCQCDSLKIIQISTRVKLS